MAKAKGRVAIDISSSPEPEYSYNCKPKGTRTMISSNVIELTDSDDSDSGALPARVCFKAPTNAVAGPSSRPNAARQLQPRAGGSNSIENIPVSHRKAKAPASRTTPLFLPSDEENNPPPGLFPPPAEFPDEAFDIYDEVFAVGQPSETQPSMHTPNKEAGQPVPVSDPDPQSTVMARVLEIVPDVEPDWLLALVTKHMLEHPDQDVPTVVEHVLHALLEDPKYPKVDRLGKGKRKQTAEEADAEAGPAKKLKIDYKDKNRPVAHRGAHYADLALEHLQVSFPFIPKTYLRTCLTQHNGLYAPTHLYLLEQEKTQQERRDAGERVNLPYNKRVTPFRPKGKGAASVQDEDFEAERKWLVAELTGTNTADADAGVEDANDASDGECEDGIECGCCFSKFRFDKIVQCPETHLFCVSCMTSYASTLLGTHDPNIKCMDQSGCSALIPASELRRFLPKKLMELWERVKQRKEVEAAGLEGLEECPFCEWGCVIENEDEKLLRCGNVEGGCGVVSCRKCKRPDHLPKSCKEVEEDRHLDGRHAIEEAMTQALKRDCPKCSKPFIKESGCNKMTCPHCSTLSCYVCRNIITGYDHFDQSQPGSGSSKNAGKCLLWEPVEQRHADEVKAAAERALAEYKRDNPDVEEKDIKIDLPVAPPPPAAANNPYGYPYAINHHVQQLLRNAQATLERAAAEHGRLRAAEEAHRAVMLEREADIRLLQDSAARMPHMAEAYRVRAQELARQVAQDQGRWYQMRMETQNANVRVEMARAQVAVYQGQQARNVHAQPAAYNVNVNVNMFGAGLGMGVGVGYHRPAVVPPPRIARLPVVPLPPPPRAAAPRRPRARRRR
ncbi:putative in Between Ring fingers [Lyophyllum shimeji]|uniref:In Between Ring fingers n=1 Tax=Lyophyllum shimeji TaxID=47721 RepID=A0A9P3PYT3_LYOSH|nr:putative in Between Ring fingers [Lyophyllum shimeji]